MDERDEKIDKLSTENLMLHEELAQWGTVQHVARSDVKGYRTQVVFDVPLRAYLFAKNLVGVL